MARHRGSENPCLTPWLPAILLSMKEGLDVPTLTTGKLRLRPFRESDLNLVEEASQDPYIPLITTIPLECSPEEGTAFIERQWHRASSGYGYPFVIEDLVSGQGVGFIGLWLRDLDRGRSSIGYWVLRPERGRGIARRALAVVARWGLEDLKIPRLELYVEPWNEASIRTAEAVGFVREGLLRSWEQVGDERRDMYMYAFCSPP